MGKRTSMKSTYLAVAAVFLATVLLPDAASAHGITVIRGADAETVNLSKARKAMTQKGSVPASADSSEGMMHARFHKRNEWEAVAGSRFWLYNAEESRVIGCKLVPRVVIDRRPRNLIECSEKSLR